MKNPVIIKGTKSGIIVHLDDKMPFGELKEKVCEKFKTSSDFLGSAQIALSFEGRKLSDEEQLALVSCITENSELDIVCVIDDNAEREAHFSKTLEEKLMSMNSNTGQFYKGTLRSGQVLEFETSIVILGDVNAGAQVVSTGNVIVLGKLLGNVYAGASGKENCFVVALKMNPTQIRIGDIIARSPDEKQKTVNEAKIAFSQDGNIYIETLDRTVLNDISL
ncbi:MAG: septum site-determining protein MinC [Roseburia sp.]|nr:septum site-determining protein MinC [Roseburia sp.]